MRNQVGSVNIFAYIDVVLQNRHVVGRHSMSANTSREGTSVTEVDNFDTQDVDSALQAEISIPGAACRRDLTPDVGTQSTAGGGKASVHLPCAGQTGGGCETTTSYLLGGDMGTGNGWWRHHG
jgi:hypothetical protein